MKKGVPKMPEESMPKMPQNLQNVYKYTLLSLALRSINFKAGDLEALAIVEIMELINEKGDQVNLKDISKVELKYLNAKNHEQNNREETTQD